MKTLKLTQPQVDALITALEQYTDLDPTDTDAIAVLTMLESL